MPILFLSIVAAAVIGTPAPTARPFALDISGALDGHGAIFEAVPTPKPTRPPKHKAPPRKR